jgi:hypothetical protein
MLVQPARRKRLVSNHETSKNFLPPGWKPLVPLSDAKSKEWVSSLEGRSGQVVRGDQRLSVSTTAGRGICLAFDLDVSGGLVA